MKKNTTTIDRPDFQLAKKAQKLQSDKVYKEEYETKIKGTGANYSGNDLYYVDTDEDSDDDFNEYQPNKSGKYQLEEIQEISDESDNEQNNQIQYNQYNNQPHVITYSSSKNNNCALDYIF